MEFLLFSGDYDAVLSRTGALSDHKRSSNRLEGEDVEDVYRGRGEYTAAPRLPAGLHLALCATGLGAQVNDDSSTEQRWLRVARAGGPKAAAAFGHLVDLHQARVVRLITHLLGRAADAEDVAQEAFVRAFLALPRHPQDAPFW
ncbi:MAG: sigma factor, partial [Polyangiaceae bacterium]